MSRSFRRMAVGYRRVADYFAVGKGLEQENQCSQARRVVLSTLDGGAAPCVAGKIAWVRSPDRVQILTSNWRRFLGRVSLTGSWGECYKGWFREAARRSPYAPTGLGHRAAAYLKA